MTKPRTDQRVEGYYDDADELPIVIDGVVLTKEEFAQRNARIQAEIEAKLASEEQEQDGAA